MQQGATQLGNSQRRLELCASGFPKFLSENYAKIIKIYPITHHCSVKLTDLNSHDRTFPSAQKPS